MSTSLRLLALNRRLPSTSLPNRLRHAARHQTRSLATNAEVPRSGWGTFAKFTAATVLGLGAYTLGSIYPPLPLTILFPRAAPAPPSDPDSAESKAYTQALEKSMLALPILEHHRSQPEAADWYETRPYLKFPEERRVNNLTSGALRGPGKLAIPPLVRARNDETEALVFVHLGRGLCGHDGIVHGGLLATLLDESLARVAIMNLPDKVGVTAKLSINYRAPTIADQFVVIKVKLEGAEGRRSQVSGRVEDLKGTLLVEATATFVQPRYAKLLNSKVLKTQMGEREQSS
ncbi:Thioesterase/thiol ester dehydrase-isomerase [Pluteus cervinus]|uniref:Thioesterase/thiol ester dehydrase-isomerase n=1 Tax=Pluteus cervinus TaxID=181527 RepID=A0ACD3A9T6_9AGAR|nr:Thioesterase/thiol ester dehydrase-isomerase [Pluteus cervinus]